MKTEPTEARTKFKSRYSDNLNPSYTRYISKSEQQKKLWPTIAEFVSQQGGWVISQPHKWPMRVEVRKDSALPAKLMKFGYAVHQAGTTLRTTSDGFAQTDILELALPK